ncbi:MAG: transcriptional repressor [Edaphocola sp.]
MITEAEDILRQHQLKSTRLRKAVLGLLLGTEKGLSHQELSRQLDMDFDRVTLFRTLHAFEENGILHSIKDLNGTARYALSTNGKNGKQQNHAHFLCLECHEVYCLQEVFPLEKMKVPLGFAKQAVDVHVKGICEKCGAIKKEQSN